MKRTFLSILTVFLTTFTGISYSSAQNYDDQDPLAHRHEVKLNLSKTIISLSPEVSYEYILKPDMSIGGRLSLMVGDNSISKEVLGNFQLNPYYRWFFTSNGSSARRVAKGFFAEVNMAMTSYNSYIDGNKDIIINGEPIRNGSTSPLNLGIGFGIGWKYVSHSGWVCDILYGGGRNFKSQNLPGWFVVGGISIGKRF